MYAAGLELALWRIWGMLGDFGITLRLRWHKSHTDWEYLDAVTGWWFGNQEADLVAESVRDRVGLLPGQRWSEFCWGGFPESQHLLIEAS